MSHGVIIETKVHDPAAVAAACRRLNLSEPVEGTARLYNGEAAGLIVRLPGWRYPAVFGPLTGAVRYDNFDGFWGSRPSSAGFSKCTPWRRPPWRPESGATPSPSSRSKTAASAFKSSNGADVVGAPPP